MNNIIKENGAEIMTGEYFFSGDHFYWSDQLIQGDHFWLSTPLSNF